MLRKSAIATVNVKLDCFMLANLLQTSEPVQQKDYNTTTNSVFELFLEPQHPPPILKNPRKSRASGGVYEQESSASRQKRSHLR
jgi:hypothetical protein